MYVLFDSECSTIPDGVKLLTSESDVLLNLLLVLGYDPIDPPFADLLRQYHHLDGEWLVLSPVHWEASHNDAMIVTAGKDLQLDETEAQSWFNLFFQYLKEEGIMIHYHNAVTWLYRNDQNYPLKAKPVHRMLNQSLMPELIQIDKTMYWQKFITESQMLFASKPKQSLINGLWAWGSAKLTDKKEVNICVDEEFLPLAQICSSNVTVYDPSVSIKRYQILLLTEFSKLSEQHQEELKKMPVHWYWNNAAFTMSSGSWYTRLWRKLIHAY